jgi:hypothetical protein
LIASLIQTSALLLVREPFLVFADYWYAGGVAIITPVLVVIVFFA